MSTRGKQSKERPVIIANGDKTEVREYLLGRLPEAHEEEFELRLMSDPAFGEEFDTVVDEITDEYLKNELSGDERERIQKYFFSSAERKKKLEFAAELLDRAKKKESRPSFVEQIAAFFRQQSLAPVGLAAVAVVIVAGIFIYNWTRPAATYLALNLAISTAERANGAAAQAVKLPSNTGLKITLTIPENARGAKGYVARLAGGNTDLPIDQGTEQTITVVIPPGSLTPGTYAIQLSKIKSDNTTERIPGSYYFAVE